MCTPAAPIDQVQHFANAYATTGDAEARRLAHQWLDWIVADASDPGIVAQARHVVESAEAKQKAVRKDLRREKREAWVAKAQLDNEVRKALQLSLSDKPVLSPALPCPHCGEKGNVHIAQVKVKKGFSAGKVSAGIVTGGASLLATGLARKGMATRCYCAACKMPWTVQ